MWSGVICSDGEYGKTDRVLWRRRWSTFTKVRVRHGYDSESNHEPTQNQMFFAWVKLIWIEKWGSTLSYESIWINTWGIHLSHELILSQFLESLESWVESTQVFVILLESWADSNQGTSLNGQKRSAKLSESPKKVNETEWKPKKVNEIEWKPKKGQRNHRLIRISESWLDSNQYSRFFESWVDLN